MAARSASKASTEEQKVSSKTSEKQATSEYDTDQAPLSPNAETVSTDQAQEASEQPEGTVNPAVGDPGPAGDPLESPKVLANSDKEDVDAGTGKMVEVRSNSRLAMHQPSSGKYIPSRVSSVKLIDDQWLRININAGMLSRV